MHTRVGSCRVLVHALIPTFHGPQGYEQTSTMTRPTERCVGDMTRI